MNTKHLQVIVRHFEYNFTQKSMDAHCRHKGGDIETDGEQLLKHQTDERFDSAYSSYNSVNSSSSIQGFKSDLELRREITQISSMSKSTHNFDSFNPKDSGVGLDSVDSAIGKSLQSVEIEDDILCEKASNVEGKFQISDISERLGDMRINSLDSLGSSCSSIDSDRVTPEAMVVYGKDEDGDTLLNIAILERQTQLVSEFIKLAPGCVWLDIQNSDMWQTPLHLAALTHQMEIARRLMVGGADIEIQDSNGDTPLHIACRLGDIDMVSVLLRPIELSETQFNEYRIPVRQVPQNLEIRNSNGYTCLHESALNGQLNIMKVLISKGAQVNTKECKCGATVLHMAIDRSNSEMVSYLLSRRDTNIDNKLYNGTTPMLLSHYRKNTEILEKLKRAGASFGNLSLTGSPNSSEDDDM